MAEQKRIVLTGHTGSGKSATGNTILGMKVFKSVASTEGVTTSSQLGKADRFGHEICLLDTPGLFDDSRHNEAVIQDIVKGIDQMHPGPHAFILTLCIGRFTKAEENTVHELQKHFGQEFIQHLIIAFTKVDDLEDEGIEDYAKTVPTGLADLLKSVNGRYIGFNNKASMEEKERTAQQLLQLINQTITGNKSPYYTKEMYLKAQADIRSQEEEIRKQQELEQAEKVEEMRKQYIQRMENEQREKDSEMQTRSAELKADKDLRLVVIGKTGSGKSSSGNTILGQEVFYSVASGSSITRHCEVGRGQRHGRNLLLVDTPGLFDTGLINEEISDEILKCVALCAPGPHALILVTSIGRFTQEESNTVQYFRNLFGEGILKHLVIIFTRKDDLDENGTSFEEYLSNVPEGLRRLLCDCEHRCVAFNNKGNPREKDEQVRQLLQVVDNMVEQNGGSCYSTEMLLEAERIMKEREKELRRLFETKRQQAQQTSLGMEEREKKLVSLRDKELEDLRRQIEALQSQRHSQESQETSRLRNEIAELRHVMEVMKESAAQERVESERRQREFEMILIQTAPNFRRQVQDEVCQNNWPMLAAIRSGLAIFFRVDSCKGQGISRLWQILKMNQGISGETQGYDKLLIGTKGLVERGRAMTNFK